MRRYRPVEQRRLDVEAVLAVLVIGALVVLLAAIGLAWCVWQVLRALGVV